MGKLKYLFKRIKSMDYKKFFSTINDVHKRSKKPRVIIFFDMIVCGLKYQAGYMDYQLFEMYKMNSSERKTIITRGINNEIQKKYNDPRYTKIFRDKVEFNKKFDKYLNRDWIYLDDNYKDFQKFLKGKEYIMIKPTSGSCGQDISKLKVDEYDPKELYQKLISNETRLAEEVAVQCKEISKVHPNSINTIRVVTLCGDIAAAFLRMGNEGNIVDNFNHDGLAAPIDIESGIIKYKAIDKKHHEYDTHPYTNVKIVGLKIPKWESVKELCREAAKNIPEVGYVGWDVCIGEEKPFLIEGNEFPGHDIYQLPPHRDGNTGLLPHFKKIMEENK